jgi:hypothetical protein
MSTATVTTGHDEQLPTTDSVTVHVGNSGCGYRWQLHLHHHSHQLGWYHRSEVHTDLFELVPLIEATRYEFVDLTASYSGFVMDLR